MIRGPRPPHHKQSTLDRITLGGEDTTPRMGSTSSFPYTCPPLYPRSHGHRSNTTKGHSFGPFWFRTQN